MPAPKMRVEVFADNGNRYKITFQGRETREKALRILDIFELLGGMREFSPKWDRNISELSKYDKARLAIDKHFPARAQDLVEKMSRGEL